jgi:hypothetical protein
LAKYNLLHDAQSDFRSNHSCQTALVNIIDKWIEERNNVESSAHISVLQFEILKGISFIYKINNNGPSIELEVLHDLLDIY